MVRLFGEKVKNHLKLDFKSNLKLILLLIAIC